MRIRKVNLVDVKLHDFSGRNDGCDGYGTVQSG